jgi:RNA polymerase sigma-54 factor
MALSASLHLRQSQSLVMTPQLMQSIRLLQMTHADLTRFVEEEIERNPLLDHAPEGAAEDGKAEPAEASPSDGVDESWFSRPGADGGEAIAERLDTNYENLFPDDGAPRKADVPELIGQWKSMPGANSAGGDFDIDDFAARAETLEDHVAQQIAFMRFSAGERLIAAELADQLDEAGYLQTDCGEVARRLGSRREIVEDVLARLQQLEPPGIFARSLAECLEIQLRQQGRFDPAMAALLGHLDLLARRDFQALKRLCGVDEADLLDMLAEIRSLDPKPGNCFTSVVAQTIVADVLVSPGPGGGWQVELNPETLPKVLVNRNYYAEVSRLKPGRGEDHDFLGTCLQNANWLARSLDQRARTILKVAREIVRQQDSFLMDGVAHLRPLTLKAVADAIGMHESTVSRVTSNKYMLTPRGVFELKYFFTVPIASAEGGEAHSAEAVRHRIREMIDGEAPHAVLSDDAIVACLKASGIDIARRTVAKYREAMNLPSSVERRREKKALARSSGA